MEFFKQYIILFVGQCLLYVYLKVRGKEVHFQDIVHQKNETSGFEKYHTISYVIGLVFFFIVLLAFLYFI